MSHIQNDKSFEGILDSLPAHIECYFRDMGNNKTDEELLDFIFGNDEAWDYLVGIIQQSELGLKIAQAAFENLQDAGEDPRKD